MTTKFEKDQEKVENSDKPYWHAMFKLQKSRKWKMTNASLTTMTTMAMTTMIVVTHLWTPALLGVLTP